jgi:hypothetical protein
MLLCRTVFLSGIAESVKAIKEILKNHKAGNGNNMGDFFG